MKPINFFKDRKFWQFKLLNDQRVLDDKIIQLDFQFANVS